MKEIVETTRDQRDLIRVISDLGKPLSSNSEIYAEYRKQHPRDTDPVKDREARIRNVLQRNCETSSRFKDGDGCKIFGTSIRGFWGLTPEYLAATMIGLIRWPHHDVTDGPGYPPFFNNEYWEPHATDDIPARRRFDKIEGSWWAGSLRS